MSCVASKKSLWRNLLDQGGLEEEMLPGQSVVELLGDNRVLIENHRRIMEYEREQMCIRVSFGSVRILGCNLQLRHVTGRKLLITGNVERIELHRGHHS